MTRAVVIADGEPVAADRLHLTDADWLVAADGGARWLDRWGAAPHLLVGDLDSVAPELIERLAGAGVEIERHPAEKHESDTELALRRAVDRGAQRIIILGALAGNRLDHEVANLLLLVAPQLRGRDVRIVRGGTTVRALHAGENLELDGEAGDVVSLLPLGGDATGVTTGGLRYALSDEPLRLGASRGLSNVVKRAPAWVEIRAGTLLVIETRKGELQP